MVSPDRYVRGLRADDRVVDRAVDRTVGGKARGLARLAALGLPVPAAVVITGDLFRALTAAGPPLPLTLASAADLRALEAARDAVARTPWPSGFLDELYRALEALDAAATEQSGDNVLFSARSSVGSEDVAGALAAGIYTSVLRVQRDALPDAVRTVLASALHPSAFAYRQSRGAHSLASATEEVAVLLHRYIDATAQGTVVFDPATGGAPRIELSNDEERIGTRARHVAPHDAASVRSYPADAASPLFAAIAAGARAAADAYGAIEVEWAAQGEGEGERVVFLQLRPFTPAAAPLHAKTVTSAANDWAALARDGWVWDFGHNPAPLSPAQAGLVALVDERCQIGFRQRVVNGFLFYRPTDVRPAAAAVDIATARSTFEALRRQVDARLATLRGAGSGGAEPSSSALESALNLFIEVYQPLFAVIQPAQRAAIARLVALLSEHGLDPATELPRLLSGVPSAATDRAAAAAAVAQATNAAEREAAVNAYIARFGDESPRWDVVEPTYAENPAPVLALALAASVASRRASGSAAAADAPVGDLRRRFPPELQHEVDLRLADARAAAALGEDDDALYAKVQSAVRRALLALGDRLVAEGALDRTEDVFFIPLELARAIAAGAPARREELLPAVTAARHAHTTARASSPALHTAGDHRMAVVRGACGAPGQAVGRAVHHVPGHVTLSAAGVPSILIAATLLPTELPLLPADAVVVEHGSVLGHVACQARERGIPALVQAHGALANIPEGAWILVDADRGAVILL